MIIVSFSSSEFISLLMLWAGGKSFIKPKTHYREYIVSHVQTML